STLTSASAASAQGRQCIIGACRAACGGVEEPTAMTPESIATPRLELRPLRPSDREEFVRVHTVSREQFARWMPTGMMERPPQKMFEESLQRARAESDSGAGLRLGGFLRESGRLA